MNVTCHIIFCMIARVIPRISLQNFMKTYRNFLTKNTENVRPSPPKKKEKKLEIAPSKGQYLPESFLV